MTDMPKSKKDRDQMMAGAYDSALVNMKKLAENITGLQEQLAELKRAVPEGIALTAKAHVYVLFGLVDGKERFEPVDLPAVYDVMRRFTDFLPDARRLYEQMTGDVESRFLPVDENIRIAASDNDPEVQRYQKEFRQAWQENMLGLVKQYVHDQFKLTEGSVELGIDDFLKLYETAFTFFFILRDEMKYVEALARETGGHDGKKLSSQ